MNDTKPRSPLRLGCLLAIGVLALAAVVGLGTSGFALWQTRSLEPESLALVLDEASEPGARRLSIDVAVSRLLVTPAPAGESLRADADFDPHFHQLIVDEGEGGLRLRFGPVGSEALALLRVKLGAEPPLLRLHVPSDLAVELDGRLRASFAAMEFGGSELRALDLELEGAGVTVSFIEPLASPMRSLRMVGDKGRLEVTGLGHASPEQVLVRQRLGELVLDLRGAWSRDSELQIGARFGGGSLWLPSEGVIISGLEDRPIPATEPEPLGDPRPHLDFTIETTGGRLFIID